MALEIIARAPLVKYEHSDNFFVDDKKRGRYITLSADVATERFLKSQVGEMVVICLEEKEPEPSPKLEMAAALA